MFFRDANHLHQILVDLFNQIAQDPQAAAKVSDSHLVIRFRLKEPTHEFMINGRRRPPDILFKKVDTLRPDLEIEMSADAFHKIMMGDLPLGKAYGGKLVQVRGPILKSFILGDLFHSGQRIYPELWKQSTIDNLI